MPLHSATSTSKNQHTQKQTSSKNTTHSSNEDARSRKRSREEITNERDSANKKHHETRNDRDRHNKDKNEYSSLLHYVLAEWPNTPCDSKQDRSVFFMEAYKHCKKDKTVGNAVQYTLILLEKEWHTNNKARD